jgi:DNA-binding beta-propeller fold protein YncE
MRFASFLSYLVCGLSALLAGASACSSSSDSAAAPPSTGDVDAAPSSTGGDASAAADTGADPACPRTSNTTDRVRKVIVSHPNDANADKAKDYEILELGLDGNLTRNGPRFSMGRNFDAPIVFSPDGVIGVAVQDDDGTLGIFRFDPGATAPVVVDPGFGKGLFYADWIAFSPDGSRVFVADINRTASGGVHEVAIGCDGTPTYEGHVLTAPGSGALAFVPGTSRALVMAASAQGVPAGNDALLVDLTAGATPSVAASVSLFGDDELDPHGIGITPDAKLALVPDGNEAFGTHRLGVLSLDQGAVQKVTVADLESPSGIVVSPYGNAALVTAAGGPSVDGLIGVKIDPKSSTSPVTITGKIAATPKPQLPTGPVLIQTGALRGLVLVSEVDGIRRVRFEPDGSLTDLGLYVLQGGLEASPGSVGVQP